MTDSIICMAPDEAAMVAFGGELALSCKAGCSIHLRGELGMGKTTLCRGFVQAMGHPGAVKSPTYTLVEPYEFDSLTIYHFDLYRVLDAEELEFMGYRDYFNEDSVCLVEWPERGGGLLPPADLVITIGKVASGRSLTLDTGSVRGVEIVAAMVPEVAE